MIETWKKSKIFKKKKKKKKKKGSMVPQQELENDLTEPSLTPPTGFFFSTTKIRGGQTVEAVVAVEEAAEDV